MWCFDISHSVKLITGSSVQQRSRSDASPRRHSRAASSDSLLSGLAPTKFPRMRRDLPRGPGGQFRRKPASSKTTKQEIDSDAADQGEASSSRSTRRTSIAASLNQKSVASYSTSSRRKSAPELPLGRGRRTSLAESTLSLAEKLASRTRTHRKGPREISRSPPPTAPASNPRGRSSRREGLATRASTPASRDSNSKSKSRTTSSPPVTPPRRSARGSTTNLDKRTTSTPLSSLSDSESDAPKQRVLRPRLPQAVASSSQNAPQPVELSPTAPNERKMRELQARTQKKKPQWKGWVALPSGTCDQCLEVHEELKGLVPTDDEKLICLR